MDFIIQRPDASTGMRSLDGQQEQPVVGDGKTGAAIARSLDPPVILVDEANLDRANNRKILNPTQRLDKEFGKTMLIATHDPQAGCSTAMRMGGSCPRIPPGPGSTAWRCHDLGRLPSSIG
jgi:ABC-type cobalamin/Fe3+-siderophores transport system ATPase subunit